MEVLQMELLPKSISILKDKGSGGHRRTESTSFAAIGATLVPVVITAVIYIIAFLYLRKPYRNIYAPRTYFASVPEKDRTSSSSRHAVSWYHDYYNLDDKFVLRHSSMDAYLFLRFLKLTILISFVGCCLTWPILFPINVHGGGTSTQLDVLSFSNIDNSKLLYAHAVVAWLFLGFVILLVTRERLFAIGLRQANTSIKKNAKRLSSRVVLFLAVPKEALSENNMKRIFGQNVVRSWIATNIKELEDAVADRTDKISDLESAEVALEKKVNKALQEGNHNGQSSGDAVKLSKFVDRPKHRTQFLVGNKVDTIDTLRKEIPDLVSKIDSLRESHSDGPDRHSTAIFVEYKDQVSAQQAFQQVRHHSPLSLQPRFIGVVPKEVLWSNLNMEPPLRISYYYMAIAFIIATIILWSIPIGIIGTISNINYLTDKVKFLRFINDLPAPILGFLEGFVPAYVLSTVVSYVPDFFRWIGKLSGQPTTVEAEKFTQKWYFAFQVIQVFLVTTFSSGAATVATKIANNPASIPTLLAKNLPKASNFYLSYFILQGIATSANQVLNYSDLLSYLFYQKYLNKTPRQQYTLLSNMKGSAWGKTYPKFVNFAVIAIAYSCIAPLMLGFATIGLFFFYLCYRYNFLYVTQVKLDSRGACYSLALQQLMTGIYLSELCLLGLFGIREASGPSTMMVILFIATVVYHVTVNKYLNPLELYTPLDVLYGEGEEEPLLSAENGESGASDIQREESRIHRLGAGKLPRNFLDPLATLFEPHIFASQDTLRPWLEDPEDDESVPEYTDDELKNAYRNPALTSKTPKVWIPRDANGISTHEIDENQKVGLSSTDDGAKLDTHGKLIWDRDDFSNVPIFKPATKY